MILIIYIFSISLNLYKVEAYSGELDPESYITLPSRIYVSDGVGTGTISLSSSASDYDISYQKIDITESTFNNIKNKAKEINDYVEESGNTLKEKEANVKTLQTEYETLYNSGTATEEQLTEAQNKYTEAYNDYQEFYNTASANITTLQDEYYALIPNYTNSWTNTTNSSNNVQLDFKNYTGKVYFILWAKIENGTNTYYDMNGYTSEIEDGEDGEWTDFSNAKFELKKDGTSKAIIEISNVIAKDDSSYYLFINSNNNKPNVSSDMNDKILYMSYDKENKMFKTTDTSKVAKYVELNQDLYITILEKQSYNSEKVVVYGEKLNRFDEPKYSDAFHATFMTIDTDQIVTRFTHSGENNRKMQIKVGKVTDSTILQKIKNKDSSGFASLLSLAKSNDGIYNKTVAVNGNDYAIEYCAGGGWSKENEVINLQGLKDGEYYFLYVKTLDENGKYIEQEAVTLAQANVLDNHWSMFFYGSSDFKWADFGNTEVDNTTADGNLPQAGVKEMIWTSFIVVLLGVGTFSYIQYRKNNF